MKENTLKRGVERRHNTGKRDKSRRKMTITITEKDT